MTLMPSWTMVSVWNNKIEGGKETDGEIQMRGQGRYEMSLWPYESRSVLCMYFEQDRKLVLAPRNLWVSTCGVLLRVLREELGEKNVVLK